MAFSHFFFKSLSRWQKVRATGRIGDSWEGAGQCLGDRQPALSLSRGRVPPLTFCMARLKGVWCHKWCLPVQRRTRKWHHLVQEHTHRGRLNTQLHLFPSQPSLTPILHYGNKYFRFAKGGIWATPVLPSLAVFLPPSGPWIPHLENEENDSAFLLWLLSVFSELRSVKDFTQLLLPSPLVSCHCCDCLEVRGYKPSDSA